MIVDVTWRLYAQTARVARLPSLISMHRDDHRLVGTVSVPIRTDPFGVHAVSEKRRVGRILCSAPFPVAVDNQRLRP